MRVTLREITVVALMVAACAGDDATHTLYSSTSPDRARRIHLATFDTDERAAPNREACEAALKLMASNVAWCEKGRAPKAEDERTYTLYRDIPGDPAARIHIATFDVEKTNGNGEDCELAGKLYQRQPGVKVRYWCEYGRYRK